MITAVGDNELPQESSANYDYAHPNDHHTGPYLMGPMVIRVYPDGRPVPSDAQRPLPKDEDIEDIRYSRLPTIKDLEAAKKSAVVAVVAAPTSAPATAAASDNVKTFSEPPRELLPPRKSVRSNFYRIGAPARFYSRIARPNNLLVRERYYWTGHTHTERESMTREGEFFSRSLLCTSSKDWTSCKANGSENGIRSDDDELRKVVRTRARELYRKKQAIRRNEIASSFFSFSLYVYIHISKAGQALYIDPRSDHGEKKNFHVCCGREERKTMGEPVYTHTCMWRKRWGTGRSTTRTAYRCSTSERTWKSRERVDVLSDVVVRLARYAHFQFNLVLNERERILFDPYLYPHAPACGQARPLCARGGPVI